MDRKLLAVALAALVAGALLGNGLGAEKAKAAAEQAKQAAFNDGRGAGCSTAVQLLTPFGKEISCAVEKDGALYLQGQMVKGGSVNLDAELAKVQGQ